MTFAERMAALASTHAQHAALIDRNAPITFSALHARTNRLAAALSRLGVTAGDRVAIWLPNCLAWVESFLACAHLGAVVLAINTRFRSQEVADIIGRGRADWLIMWPDFKGIAFGDILAEGNNAGRFAVVVDERGIEPVALDGSSVLGDILIGAARAALLVHQVEDHLVDMQRGVLRNDQLDRASPDGLLPGVTENLLGCRVPFRDLGAPVHLDHGERRAFDMEQEFLLRAPERLVGHVPFRTVFIIPVNAATIRRSAPRIVMAISRV